MQLLWSYSVCKNVGTRLELLEEPDGIMIMSFHIYGPGRFHKTWDIAKWPSVCGVTVSARIWVPDGNSQNSHRINHNWVARLRTKMVPGNLQWSKSAHGLWTYSQKCSCLDGGARPNGLDEPMTMSWHIYGPRLFHRRRDGANRSSGYGVITSQEFGNPVEISAVPAVALS